MRRAEKLGIFRTLPDGRVEVISPQLLRAAAELAELGVGAEGALVTAEKLRRHADGAARAFVDLFVKEVWQPVRPRRPARARLAADERGARTDAAARRRRPAGDLPDRDGGGGREGERTHPAARRPSEQALRQASQALGASGESRVVHLLAGRLAAGVGEDGEIHQRGEERVEILDLAFLQACVEH